MRFIHSQLVQTPCASCEQAFRALPRHRGFRDVWMDPGVWIRYTSSIRARGYTHPNGLDVAVTLAGFGASPIQWRSIAATLVHEMAHVNGAPGTDRTAEAVLRECLFADHHDPYILG